MSGLLGNFLARELFSNVCLRTGELDPILNLTVHPMGATVIGDGVGIGRRCDVAENGHRAQVQESYRSGYKC